MYDIDGGITHDLWTGESGSMFRFAEETAKLKKWHPKRKKIVFSQANNSVM